MSDYFIGEIRLFAGYFAPQGWAMCDGSLQSLNQYQALYSLIGTTYGGNGTTNFALPDLRGRIPVGQGQGTNLTSRILGQSGGTETVTLDESTMPGHSHAFMVSSQTATLVDPTNAMYASCVTSSSDAFTAYTESTPTTTPVGTATILNSAMLTNSGSGGAHANVMGSLVLTYIIALNGLYPTRN